MAQVTVFDMAGKSVGEMTLSDAIFGIEPNTAVMHAAVVNYLANQRQGTQSTLTRQLRELEADGFLHREVYPEVPPRVEYTLTAMGESFLPVLNHMLLWSETHLCPPDYVNPYQDGGRGPLPGTEA